MAVNLRSNSIYTGPLADLPPVNAPMPAGAAYYANALTGQYITPTTRSANPADVLDFSAMRERYIRDASGGHAQVAAAASAGRVEYGPAGPLGILAESATRQDLLTTQRQDLTAAAVSGLAVTAAGATTPAWNRWYTLAPSGDAAHDLTVTANAELAANAYRMIAVEVKSTSHPFVQLSSGAFGDATMYANFNVLTKAVVAQGAGALEAGVLPTIEGCIVYMVYRLTAAATDAPVLSIIGSASATKQAASAIGTVGAVSARLFKLRATTVVGTKIAPHCMMPSTTVSVIANNDRMAVRAALQSADYSVYLRARNTPWVNSYRPTLFYLGSSSTNGLMLRVTGGVFELRSIIAGTQAVVRTLGAAFAPGGVTTVGFSKSGTVFRMVLGNETFEQDFPHIAGFQPILAGSAIDIEGWDGHLQKVIGWSYGMTLAQLQAAVAAEA